VALLGYLRSQQSHGLLQGMASIITNMESVNDHVGANMVEPTSGGPIPQPMGHAMDGCHIFTPSRDTISISNWPNKQTKLIPISNAIPGKHFSQF
jgi:hypothetical protein